MVVRPLGLRGCVAVLFASLVLCAGLACSSSSSSDTDTTVTYREVSGTVTYTRIPLKFTDAGVPTGYETDTTLYTSLPARGITLRFFQLKPQLQADYTTVYVWTLMGATVTDVDGAYDLTGTVEDGYDTFVEMASIMIQPASNTSTISVIADEAGVYSQVPISERPVYVIRKALDGTSMDATSTHGSVATGPTTLDFTVGISDPWQVLAPRWWVPAQKAGQTTIVSGETVAAGSRILGILDTCYYFAYVYGNGSPSSSSGNLDLHYRPGVTHRRGTFVEYNIWNYPLSYDGSSYHYFGSISGGGTVDGVVQSDDAFDYGAINQMLGHNFVYAQRMTNMVPTGVLTESVMPDLAVIQGLGDAMGAIIAGSPYLPGPMGSNRYATPRDIRSGSSLVGTANPPYCPAIISAITWNLALVNTDITGTGTVDDWATIEPINLLRFYTLVDPSEDSGTSTVTTDVANIWTQLARLQEDSTSSDNSDLQEFFPDATLKSILALYDLTWVSDDSAILPKYTSNWGLDPDTNSTPLPTVTFTMANATTIPKYSLDDNLDEVETTYYPNDSKGEVLYARFALSLDQDYILTLDTMPALPTGASFEVIVDGNITLPYLFPAGTTSLTLPTMIGNPSDLTTPYWHTLRVRVFSPSVLVPNTMVTFGLVPKQSATE